MNHTEGMDYRGYFPRPVRVGRVWLGGGHPLSVQSMTNTDTLNRKATVNQVIALAEAGCDLVRVAAPTLKDARALQGIRQDLRAAGCEVPLIADIHYLPEAALEASLHVDKVRINPGNYVDRLGTLGWPLERLRDEARRRLQPLVERCREHGTAIRIGVNHGSLSRRILDAWGHTPEGMVASALEFIDLFRDLGFYDLVLSMKSSSVPVTVHSTRLLAARLKARGDMFPLHLGVTEAGSGEEGMIRSVAGIGPLLMDGLGDTLRVSITGDPLLEIPLALKLSTLGKPQEVSVYDKVYPWDSFHYFRRKTADNVLLGGDLPPKVILPSTFWGGDEGCGSPCADLAMLEDGRLVQPVEGEAPDALSVLYDTALPAEAYLYIEVGEAAAIRPALETVAESMASGEMRPLLIGAGAAPAGAYGLALHCAPFLIDGLADGLVVTHPRLVAAAFQLLQDCGRRVTRTTYIALPSCARTRFDISRVLEEVKARTGGMPGMTIAVMGCIVNGPGEMEGADFGYIGSGEGRVSLFRAGKLVERNVPESEAVERLLVLIREAGHSQGSRDHS